MGCLKGNEVDDGLSLFTEAGFSDDSADGVPDVGSEGRLDAAVDGKSVGSEDGGFECLNIL
jgi:hypothetical protein